MRKIFFLLLLLIPRFGFSQNRPGKIIPYQWEVDSIVIRAAKEGAHKIEINMVSYEGIRVLPPNPKPGEVIPLTWTKNHRDDFSASKIICVFLNDSVVEEDVDGQKYYSLIRNDKIYDYDKAKREIISYWKTCTKDSLGFDIVEQRLSWGKDSLFRYTKTIYDSSGRAIEGYSSRSGIFTNYETFKYYGDTARIEKTYFKPADSSYVSASYYGKPDSTFKSQYWIHNSKVWVPEWVVPQKDSLALMEVRYVCNNISKDRTTGIDRSNTIYYDGKPEQNPKTTEDISQYTFTYNTSGHLVAEEEVSFSSDGFSWKNEMTIIYKR